MNILKERRKKLVEALRSGKYKQGHGYLKHEYEGDVCYCCLGVATEIAHDIKWVRICDDDLRTEAVNKKIYGVDHNNYSYLPKEVMLYYGFRTSSGTFNYRTLSLDLREKIEKEASSTPPFHVHTIRWSIAGLDVLNDYRVSFDTIADVIEEEPQGLFSK